jgi:O-antigen/teichoic acid export membrane protein
MKKNFIYTAVSIGSRLLTGLVVFVFLARIWGPTDFGLFAFVFSTSALLTLVVDFGFAGYLLREVGADPAHAAPLIQNAFWAKARLVFVFVTLSVVVMAILGPAVTPPALIIPLLCAALALSFADFFVAPLRAMGRYDLETAVVTSSNLFQFLIACGVAWQLGTPIAVAWAFAVSRLCYCAAAAYALHSVLPALSLRKGRAESTSATFGKVWPYGIDGILTTSWNQMDVIAVRAIYGIQAVGLYSAGQKIVQGVSALAPVVGNVMIPRLSRLAKTQDARFQSFALRTAMAMVVIGAGFAAPLIAFPAFSSHLLYGEKFADLAELLPFFGILIAFKYIAAGSGVVVTAAGLQARRVVCQLIGFATFAALTLAALYFQADLQSFILAYVVSIFMVAALYAGLWINLRSRKV